MTKKIKKKGWLHHSGPEHFAM